MFYFFAVGSLLAYVFQDFLLIRYARKIDGLSLAFYRNVSFFITLLPLLAGASKADVFLVWQQWPLLLLSSVSGGVFLTLYNTSIRFLPAGIRSALVRAVATITIAVIGWWVFDEKLSFVTLALLGVILGGALVLGYSRSKLDHLDSRMGIGIALAAFAGLPLAVTHFSLIVLSRNANPLVSSYFWETSIAGACLILIFCRSFLWRKGLERISARHFFLIALASWPTLLGTGLYSLAAREGPAAILNGIGGLSIVVLALLAWAFYKEHLTRSQWMSISVVVVGVVALQFV